MSLEASDTLAQLGRELTELSEEERKTLESYVDKGVDVICHIISAIGPWQKIRLALQARKTLQTMVVNTPNAEGKVEFYVRKPPEPKELHILLEDVVAKPRNQAKSWPEYGDETKTSGVGFSTMKHLKDFARDSGFSEFRFLVHNLRHQSSSESLVPIHLCAPELKMDSRGTGGPTIGEIPETIARAYKALAKRYEALPSETLKHPSSGEKIVCYAYRIPTASVQSSMPSFLHRGKVDDHLQKEGIDGISHTAHASHGSAQHFHFNSHDFTSHLGISSVPIFPGLDPLESWKQLAEKITPVLEKEREKEKEIIRTKREEERIKTSLIVLPTWSYLPLTSGTPNISSPSPVASSPPILTPLQKRIFAPPKVQSVIHTQVVQQQTGAWDARRTTCYIGPDGNTKQITQVHGDTTALRPHLLPRSQFVFPPGAHFAYPGGHKEVINPSSVPSLPPPPPVRQRYCGKIFDGLTMQTIEDKCSSCKQKSGVLALWDPYCQKSFL